MIASGAMRETTCRRVHGSTGGGRLAGRFREYPLGRVSIVDREFCCLRPGTLLARARQAKGRAQNAAKRSGGRAGGPPCGGGALSGPGGARLEDVEKLVRADHTAEQFASSVD